MIINNALEPVLAQQGLTHAQFSELLIRLMDQGVLCRDESKKEAELYDRYLQIPELVEDYLAVLKIRLLHEARFCSLRLFPPGAEVPGLADPSGGFNSGLRERLSQQEVALILVLRAEYDKSLRDGQIDENGQVTLPMEALSLACRNLLKRPLPDTRSERAALFRRLRQLRLIRSAGDAALEDIDSWLVIRPEITSLVTDAVLAPLLEEADAPVAGITSPSDTGAANTSLSDASLDDTSAGTTRPDNTLSDSNSQPANDA